MELRDGNGTGKQSLAAHCNGEERRQQDPAQSPDAEAFDLLSRASALRQVDANNDAIDRGFSIEEDCYRMRLSNGDGTTLWVCLQAESRADAMWAAYALGRACSDCFEDFDLWDGLHHLLSADTKFTSFFSDSAEEVAAASQQFLLDTEETLLRSEIAVARSRKLLEATAALRDRLTRAGN